MTEIPDEFNDEFLDRFRERTEAFWATYEAATPGDYVGRGLGGPDWQRGTYWLNGLSDDEIDGVERRWSLRFPQDYRLFLGRLHSVDRPMTGAHFSDPEDGHRLVPDNAPSFYHWLTDTEAIRGHFDWLVEGLQFDVEHNVLWRESWGPKPSTLEAQKERVRALVAAAPTVRKTVKYKLQPTAEQDGALAVVVRRCRELYHAGVQERRAAWQQCGVRSTAASQSAHRPAIPALKDLRPEDRDVHSQVLHDVLARLDRAFHACCRRGTAGATPGSPRCHGAQHSSSFTSKQFGNGATRDNGFRVLSKVGRSAVRWSRPSAGSPKTVTIAREADGWYAGCSCAGVSTQPWPATGQEIGSDLGLASFATRSHSSQIANPHIFRVAQRRRKRAPRRVSRRVKGSHRRRKAVHLLARAHPTVRRARADFHHKVALSLLRRYDTI
ncbi:MAG TPA: RNA-guided endonuclease TnpB family protein [Ktedonobacterales bacterium]|nr:RNA-guided endonuclease TnpB family protein [Ktedonobacterales bacterium]